MNVVNVPLYDSAMHSLLLHCRFQHISYHHNIILASPYDTIVAKGVATTT